MDKCSVSSLALFSGEAMFDKPRSTSNLVRPDFEQYLMYSRMFFGQDQSITEDSLTRKLEKRLTTFHQASECVAVSSGFWALVLAIRCLAVPGKTEIVMPSLTYRRMADVAAWTGLIPHFCEVDPNTLAISAVTAKSVINENTALILGVQPIINCCDVDGLVALAAAKQLPLLFDSVESTYETYAGKKIGSFGNAEVFSLHASKLINGFEGGYITTNDPVLAARLRRMRAFGIKGKDGVQELGMNAMLNPIHAAMTMANLDFLDEQVKHNYSIYKAYQNGVDDTLGLRLLAFDETEKCSYKNIVVELLDHWPLSRSDTLAILHAERIVARPYYSPALHQKKMSYPVIAGNLQQTEKLAERYMLLPCGYFVQESDVDAVIELLRFIKNNAETIQKRLA